MGLDVGKKSTKLEKDLIPVDAVEATTEETEASESNWWESETEENTESAAEAVAD